MLVKELAEKIITLNIVNGLPVRVGFMEADVAKGVLVKTPLDGLSQTSEAPGWFKGPIQVIVRHPDPETGDTVARQIMSALSTVGDPLDLATYHLTNFFPLTAEPIMYPVNDAGLYEHSVNFDCYGFRL